MKNVFGAYRLVSKKIKDFTEVNEIIKEMTKSITREGNWKILLPGAVAMLKIQIDLNFTQ
jgi:hypothetical protein